MSEERLMLADSLRVVAKDYGDEESNVNEFWLPNFLVLEDAQGRPLFIKPDAITAIFFRGESVVVRMNDDDECFTLGASAGTRLLSWAQSRAIVPGMGDSITRELTQEMPR